MKNNDDIIIAKSDHTKNDIKLSVSGYPTFKLIKKDHTINECDSDRNVEAWIEYLQKEVSLK